MDAMETDTPVHAALGAAPSLDPWDYNEQVRRVQATMLDGDNDVRAAQVPALLQAYAAKAAAMSLTPTEWHIYLSIAHLQMGMDAWLDLHAQSTHDTFDMSLFVRYASLVLRVHEAQTGVAYEIDTDARVQPLHGMALSTLAEQWTGQRGPPLLDNGMYERADLGAGASALSLERVRSLLRELYGRCAWHATESQVVWRMYLAFESAHASGDEATELLHQMYVARLQVPHQQLAATFEQFSSFVSGHMPPDAYESVMAAANRHYADSLRLWEEREAWEEGIAQADATLQEHWLPYLAWQAHRVKQLRVAKDKTHLGTEEEWASMLYRRALRCYGMYPLARNAKDTQQYALVPPTPDVEKRWRNKFASKSMQRERERMRKDARESARLAEGLWLDYAALVSTPKVEAAVLLRVCADATRAVPPSGRLWALYLRALVRFQRPATQVQALFDAAIASGSIAAVGGGHALLPLLVAHIDCVRAQMTLEMATEHHVPPDQVVLVSDLDRFMRLFELLVQATASMAALPEDEQDPHLLLEKYAVDWIERAARAIISSAGVPPGGAENPAAGLLELADDVWTRALKQHAHNVYVYVEAALFYKRRDDDKRARQLFKAGLAKHGLENKLVLRQAYVQFEHERGAPAEIELVEAKLKAENDKAWRQWLQYQTHAQATDPAPQPMETDAPDVPKRKAADEAPADKRRTEPEEPVPARDREFSSVMVSGLSAQSSEADVRAFFRDCGTIFSLVGPRQVAATDEDGQPTSAALVEFTDRDGANAARTRDWKKVRDSQVHVALSYLCTLYVTNFPPDASDEALRARFAPYGPIFDVRWPSRKFQQSRRFCYVQFTTETAAQAALAEHDAHWHGEHALQVLLSNPQHKKQRSDAHANEKELYMTGLPRSATIEDVRQFFAPHGDVAEVRVPARPDGKSRGIAFIQFHTALDARRAMQATNSTKFHGRLVAVMLAEAGRSSRPARPSDDWRSRSVHVAGLPPDAQEALIQQALESALGPQSVRRVFWTPGRAPGPDGTCDSLVELADTETAGKAVLHAHASYGGAPLTLSAHMPPAAAPAPALVPRGAVAARGRRNLGFSRVHTASSSDTAPKSQDAFRDMLRK
ncbi:Splicing factor [Malassezia caprae]|uniref:Splicing factor n=1 Tax=Malassezia caprae TaxID=1381934 RepID=A0AAF0E5Q1_9BASI|nr:Splicing factor [Malassezia caprae]